MGGWNKVGPLGFEHRTEWFSASSSIVSIGWTSRPFSLRLRRSSVHCVNKVHRFHSVRTEMAPGKAILYCCYFIDVVELPCGRVATRHDIDLRRVIIGNFLGWRGQPKPLNEDDSVWASASVRRLKVWVFGRWRGLLTKCRRARQSGCGTVVSDDALPSADEISYEDVCVINQG